MRIAVFHDSRHSRLRSVQRDITLEMMMRVVASHVSREQLRPGRNGGFVYLFNGGPENGGVHVVAEVKLEECWLITAFWEIQQ